MKILHLGYSDSLGGAAIAMMRLHNSMIKIGQDSKVLVGQKLSNDKKRRRNKWHERSWKISC